MHRGLVSSVPGLYNEDARSAMPVSCSIMEHVSWGTESFPVENHCPGPIQERGGGIGTEIWYFVLVPSPPHDSVVRPGTTSS